jgi:hypothetical protein
VKQRRAKQVLKPRLIFPAVWGNAPKAVGDERRRYADGREPSAPPTQTELNVFEPEASEGSKRAHFEERVASEGHASTRDESDLERRVSGHSSPAVAQEIVDELGAATDEAAVAFISDRRPDQSSGRLLERVDERLEPVLIDGTVGVEKHDHRLARLESSEVTRRGDAEMILADETNWTLPGSLAAPIRAAVVHNDDLQRPDMCIQERRDRLAQADALVV